jgi:hypothetical protein
MKMNQYFKAICTSNGCAEIVDSFRSQDEICEFTFLLRRSN